MTSAPDDEGDEYEEPTPTVVSEIMNLSGALDNVHDPAIIAAPGQYFLYSTGEGIQWRRSSGLTEWAYGGDVLDRVLSWTEDIAEGDLWAPDVAFFNDRYPLYYSASPFGSGRSAIGVATTPVMSPDSANHEWTDHGKVIESFNANPYNAIAPNVLVNEQDRVWMAFGSWNKTGIRRRRIDPSTGKPSAADSTFYSLANRPDADENAIEAPYIIHRDGYYYLFVSFGHCCQGVDSDYNIRVDRSDSVTGPYVDRDADDGGGERSSLRACRTGRAPGTTRCCRRTATRISCTTRTWCRTTARRTSAFRPSSGPTDGPPCPTIER